MSIDRVEPRDGRESVWDYPRPPSMLPTTRRVVVEFGGIEIADSRRAIRVLETSHPPAWYVPIADIRTEHLRAAVGTSFCEWKGRATYVDLVVGRALASEAGWTYPEPNPAFAALRDHIAFYPARVDRCTVDGEVVRPQAGGFYGGWITDDVVGPFKGEPGTTDW